MNLILMTAVNSTMTNVSSSSVFENFQKCTCRMIRQCYNCFHCAGRRIHPESTCNQTYSKVIRLHGNKLIRVIHLENNMIKKSDLLHSPLHFSDCSDENKRTFSFSDSDYAFSSWSKPLRLCDDCKQSLKNVLQENLAHFEVQRDCLEDVNNFPHLSSERDLSSVEKFIDAFVKDVINDAIHSICHNQMNHSSFLFSSENVAHTVSKENKCAFQNLVQSISEKPKRTVDKECAIVSSNSILKLGSSKEKDILQLNGFSDSKIVTHSHSNFSNEQCQTNQISEETYAYYNSSYSEAEDDTNITEYKLAEKKCISQNKNFSICTHLKHKVSKPILLFLHGVGCSADLWTHMLLFFGRDGYEVVAPDMLGHGYSSTPDSPSAYRFHNLLKDTLDIFDKFVGDMKCVVIGHAFGCSLAAALARYRPQQVNQLVLVSGGGPTPLAPRRADFSPPAISPWLQMCLKPFLLCGLKREVLYVPCGKHIETADSLNSGVPPYVLHHIAHGQDWPEGDSAFHRRILVPTLLVHGMKDPYVTLVQECEMERTIPRSSLELIENAGHFAMLETPDKLCHMIQCFINWWNL